MQKKRIFFLMGPTAAGKTPLAIALAQQLPIDIISVDSALVYRGLDIGTAKPSAEILKAVPHRLIDICEPTEVYSAGQFLVDAKREIAATLSNERLPLLVGGTMMYFRILQQGLASMPAADEGLRKLMQQQIVDFGLDHLYQQLQVIDPSAAARIHPNDTQRIQRALEVYYLSEKPLSVWQQETLLWEEYQFVPLVVVPALRSVLHARIAARFQQMLADGFLLEVEKLWQRPELSRDLPALRLVGYRQALAYLDGAIDVHEMQAKTLAATRQLAKRQLTWLRAWPFATWFDSEKATLLDEVRRIIVAA